MKNELSAWYVWSIVLIRMQRRKNIFFITESVWDWVSRHVSLRIWLNGVFLGTFSALLHRASTHRKERVSSKTERARERGEFCWNKKKTMETIAFCAVVYLSVIYIILKSSSKCTFLFLSVSALSLWLQIKLHVPFFLSGNETVRVSRKSLDILWAVIEAVACRCRRHSHTHYRLHHHRHRSIVVYVRIDTVLIELCAHKRMRQRDRSKRQAQIITNRTHSGVKFIWFCLDHCCRYCVSLFLLYMLCALRTLWLKLDWSQLCRVHPSAGRMGMVMSSFSFLIHSNAVRNTSTRTIGTYSVCTPYHWT